MKQGLRHGETDWAGIDGSDRIRREADALADLWAAGVPVPAIHSVESVGANKYLITDALPGTTLDSLLSAEPKVPSLPSALELCMKVAQGVADVHQSGWIWGDCKPRNLVLDDHRNVNLIDFEGASRLPGEDVPPWSTPLYLPPSHKNGNGVVSVDVDNFALVVTLTQLLAGELVASPAALGQRRDDVPLDLLDLLTRGHQSSGRAVAAGLLVQELRRHLAGLA